MRKIRLWACTSLSALLVFIAVGGGATINCPFGFYQPELPRK